MGLQRADQFSRSGVVLSLAIVSGAMALYLTAETVGMA